MDKEITIRPAEASDQQRWDEYVCAHADCSPYHLYAWKNAVEQSYKHQSFYFLAEMGGEIVGVAPAFRLKFLFFVNELTALPYCDVGNILANDAQITKHLVSKIVSICSSKSIKKAQIRGDLENHVAAETSFYDEKTNKVRMRLELPESSELLLKSFKSKLRSQIKKAEKNGCIFTWETVDNVDHFYSVFQKNMHDLGSPVHSKVWFEKILNNYGNNARMGIVFFDKRAIGGCLILTAGKKVAIPWASTLREFNKLAPNMLLYWNVLKYSADNGFKTFDFGRSSEGEGTFKFKKQWGADPTPLPWFSNSEPPPAYGSEPTRPKINKREVVATIWSRLPDSFTQLAGPKIRKYISL